MTWGRDVTGMMVRFGGIIPKWLYFSSFLNDKSASSKWYDYHQLCTGSTPVRGRQPPTSWDAPPSSLLYTQHGTMGKSGGSRRLPACEFGTHMPLANHDALWHYVMMLLDFHELAAWKRIPVSILYSYRLDQSGDEWSRSGWYIYTCITTALYIYVCIVELQPLWPWLSAL